MSLLVLTNQELRERVMKELAENPALELLEDRVCPTCHRRLAHPRACPICSLQTGDDGAIVFTSPKDSYRAGQSGSSGSYGEDLPEREPAAPEDLAVHVLQQLAADLDDGQRRLAAYVLASLDEDGFLQDPPPILARATRASLAQIHEVLDLISHIDPPGLATTGPRQALLTQLDNQEESPLIRLARKMLENAFDLMAIRDLETLAQRFEVSVARVKEAIAYIRDNLNPYPRRGYWAAAGNMALAGDPNIFHQPDIEISDNPSDPDGPLMVEIFAPVSGWLRISPAFRAALQGAEIPEEWKEQFDRASLFVKCIQQRNNTMRQLMRVLVKRQRQFILEGDRHLISMTRAEIADEIGVHESTISRAVSEKSLALPDRRIIPLARFFDRSLPARDCIKEIVAIEVQPLTDEEISEELEAFGIRIARRTVAKYRSMEGILPARLRGKEKRSTAQHVYSQV
jgi:RNA polymerase sigma-54 factor